MFNTAYKTFLKNAKAVFNTPEGKEVLAYLKSVYVDESAYASTDRETTYKIGRQDLIKSLVRLVEDPREIDDIINAQIYNGDAPQ
jgi:hypothetical protein